MLCCLFCVSFIQLADDCCLTSWYTCKKGCSFSLFACYSFQILTTEDSHNLELEGEFFTADLDHDSSTHTSDVRDGGKMLLLVSDRSLSRVVVFFLLTFFFVGRLRSLNVAVLLLLDVDAAAVVVVLVACFILMLWRCWFCYTCCWRCFLCFVCCLGFWKFTAYRPSLPASPQWLCCSVSQCPSALSCQLQ